MSPLPSWPVILTWWFGAQAMNLWILIWKLLVEINLLFITCSLNLSLLSCKMKTMMVLASRVIAKIKWVNYLVSDRHIPSAPQTTVVIVIVWLPMVSNFSSSSFLHTSLGPRCGVCKCVYVFICVQIFPQLYAALEFKFTKRILSKTSNCERK